MNEAILFGIAASIASAWLPAPALRNVAGLGLMAVTLGLALYAQAIVPSALIWAAALLASAWWTTRAGRHRRPAWTAFIALALTLGFGLAPGFSALPLTAVLPLKEASAPYALGVRLDKALVGFALAMWIVPLARAAGDWRAVARAVSRVAPLTMLAVFPLGLALQYVQPMAGLPDAGMTLLWVVSNLLLVCPTEEGFFRGVLQRGLVRRTRCAVALLVSAALFGLAHFAGGPPYILLAFVAGAGYGLAYHAAGHRIEAAILTHFLLNIAHLGLFTYPYAAA